MESLWSSGTKFGDEFPPSTSNLESYERSKWRAELAVKSKMVENLDKSINTGMSFKKFPKFGPRDVFERWIRDLKTELGTIPLCGKRLQFGHLSNPRSKPSAQFKIIRSQFNVIQSSRRTED